MPRPLLTLFWIGACISLMLALFVPVVKAVANVAAVMESAAHVD